MSALPRDPFVVRLSLGILRLARRIVPRAGRDAWMREWEAEIRHRWGAISRTPADRWRRQADLVRRSSGAVRDAAWLRRQFTADLDVVHDVRYAVRVLRKRPVVSGLAVAVLALGIGGTVTVFSAVDALMLRTLPYADADRIVTVWQTAAGHPEEREGAAPGAFLDWRDRSRSFSQFAAAEPISFDYLGGSEPVTLVAALVTEGFFEALGVHPARGRLFVPDEYRDTAPSLAVLLSHGAWQGRFGGDEGIVGRTIVLEGQPRVVVGVLPESFHPDVLRRAREQEIWAPQPEREIERENRRTRYWSAVARLAPGVSLGEARAELEHISAQLAREYPRTMGGMTATVVPLREHMSGPIRAPLMLLFAAVVMVLLLAAANVANLLMARSAERQREFAVRAAIGARRWRLIRQLLVEATVLSAIACGLGLALALVAIDVFVGFTSGLVSQLADITLDTRLVIFAIALAAATALFVGIWPAVQLSAHAVHEGLKETAGGVTPTVRRRRFASMLVVGEVALALVLLTGAGLLIKSFGALSRVDPGFARSNVAIVQVFAYGDRYQTNAQRLTFFDQTVDRLRGVPGVVDAGLVSAMPFLPANINIMGGFRIEGRAAPPESEQPATSLTIATPDYFRAMRIPLKSGRLFSGGDHSTSRPVALVNDLVAERFWPGDEPVGQRITANWQGQWRTMEIVGVVGRTRHEGLDQGPRLEVFMPLPQVPFGSMTFVVRTAGDPGAVMPALKARIWEIDPTLPLYDSAILDDLVARSLRPRRFIMQALGALSGLAFLLAALGIYGMLTFSTTQRAREIGVRMAMGGSRPAILRMIIGEGMTLVGAGLAVGVIGVLVLRRGIATLLYGVSPLDPMTLAATAATLSGVALLACYVPARRATAIDPLDSLRAN